MGAEQPQIQKVQPKRDPLFNWVAVVGAAILVAFVALVLVWRALKEDPVPVMSPKEEAQLEKRLKEIDDSEQYALIAAVNGWYACLHSGRTMCYLHAGEVWKYGVTSKGKFGRYSVKFLAQNKVSYLVQFKGDFAQCLKQEQIRLFNYPYLPENLARPLEERLPRPPYNPIMR